MIFSKKFTTLIYLGLFLLYILGEYLISLSNSDRDYKNDIATIVEKRKESKKQLENSNYLHLIKENKNIPESKITEHFDKYYKDNLHYLSFKKSNDVKNILALGIDKKFHLSNFYLEGYAPFETNKLWVPLQTLAQKKTYELDSLQYTGYKEIWQTSSQAFKYTRGDCEDHAIALADWLIEMGEDARVVAGFYKKEGHAWVVLFKDGNEYILEATSKGNFTNPYPLAKYQTSYRPQIMFNREYFWFNKGSINTTSYSSENWLKKTIYHRIEKNDF